MNGRMRKAREERGWSQAQLLGELERVGLRHRSQLPARVTMKSMVSRWENGRSKPDAFYRQLLREVFGLDDVELGFGEEREEHQSSAAVELRAQLNLERGRTHALVKSLHAQTEAIRAQDREYGAPTLLEQMRCLVATIEHHLAHGVFDDERRLLARLLADAAALAGWQALDLDALDQAWRFFETATRAAQQADDLPLWAFARVEQAQVIVELGSRSEAAEVAQSVWERAQLDVAPPVRCWLAAGVAEMHAAAGDADTARKMLATAEALVPSLDGPMPPYLVFNSGHLDRWIGHILLLLDDPAAVLQLRRAEESLDESFARAGASLHIDLAIALRSNGQRDEAAHHIRLGEELALRIGSRRQLARVRDLQSAG